MRIWRGRFRRKLSPGIVGMWALTRNIYIKFWEGRFVQAKIHLPPELMERLAKGEWKLHMEENGILISGEAKYCDPPEPKKAERISASHTEMF